MGNYEKLSTFSKAVKHPVPDIVSTRQGTQKYGFGLNFEQQLAAAIGIFGRLDSDGATNPSTTRKSTARSSLGLFRRAIAGNGGMTA